VQKLIEVILGEPAPAADAPPAGAPAPPRPTFFFLVVRRYFHQKATYAVGDVVAVSDDTLDRLPVDRYGRPSSALELQRALIEGEEVFGGEARAEFEDAWAAGPGRATKGLVKADSRRKDEELADRDDARATARRAEKRVDETAQRKAGKASDPPAARRR